MGAQRTSQPRIRFSKMQGLGNDFMVIDGINQSVDLSSTQIQAWADRHFGIGFDQLLLVEPSDRVDFKYRIFNADGSEVQQCGNGARCFAKFVYDQGLTSKTEITVETASGVIVLYIEDNGWVRVNMGPPKFAPECLPFQAEGAALSYEIEALDQVFEIGAVSMGNPHAVLQVDDLVNYPVAQVGKVLESHSRFPERVNVGFAQIVSSNQIQLRVYERGAAETLACGTGACAAMVVLRARNQVDNGVLVSLPGGDLKIVWSGEADESVWMSGPAVTVFSGEIACE